jgi:hypothetical protein
MARSKKVRVFEFADTEEGRERLSMLYFGFVSGGNQPGTPKGMEVIRREARILDKFAEISESSVTKQIDRPDTYEQVMHPGPQKFALEEVEYELLRKYFERAGWNVSAARKVVDISEWMSSIPQTEEE